MNSSNTYFTDEWLSTIDCDIDSEQMIESNRLNDSEVIVEKIVNYYKEILGKDIDESLVPKVKQMVTDGDVDNLAHILSLVMKCDVNEEEKEVLMNAMVDTNDEIPDSVAKVLEDCTQTESIDCSDGNIIYSNNLSEEEINESMDGLPEKREEKTESNSDINSNSMISCPDIKAKEPFAQTSNDLENELNNKNHLIEENRKLIIENEKYKKLIERMNKIDVPFTDPNISSDDEINVIKNQNICLQNEIIKMKETEETYLIEMSVLREQLNHSKANHCEPLIWNRDAITNFCDREYLYKLIIR